MTDLAPADAAELPTDEADAAVLPIVDRARNLRIALAAQFPLLVMRAGAVWRAREVLDTWVIQGGAGRLEDAEASFLWVQLLTLGAFAVTGWLFVSWTRSLYEAAPSLRVSGLRRGAGSAWMFFAPVVSLWVPYQMISEFHEASSPDGLAPRGVATPTPGAPIGAWWALWVGSGAVQLVGALLAEGPRTSLPRSTVSELVALGMLAAAAVLAMRVVGRVTARAVERSRRVENPPEPMVFG